MGDLREMAREIRGDIQGLRAVAVAVVICAHAGVPVAARRLRRRRRLLRHLRLPDLRPAVPRGPGHRRRLDRPVLGPPRAADPARRDAGHGRHRARPRCWSWASWTPGRWSSTRSGPRSSPPTSTSPSRASTTSRRTPARRRCSTTGRWRWRSSSTSSGRCCCSALLALTRLLTGRNPQRLPRRAVLVLLLVVVFASLAWSIHQTVAVPDRRRTSRPSPGPGSSASAR